MLIKWPEERVALSFGALLHDIGKVVYRGSSEQGTHSKLGAQFVSEDVAALNEAFASEAGQRIVRQIRYHHARELAAAQNVPCNDLAYITYFADNISAGMDRKNEGEEDVAGFDRNAKLQRIFNIVNDCHNDLTLDHEDYNNLRERIKRGLASMSIDESNLNSLLNLLEATTDTIPSSTNKAELIDVSLFDHAKTTAGIAACIYDYLSEKEIDDYARALFSSEESQHYYEEPMFLLLSYDMSGIQSFIYNISGTGALKQLRARSWYLEMLLEHIADELLAGLGLCRANLLYTGGGHAYFLLPNTANVQQYLREFFAALNEWFIAKYRTDLYLASAWVECSAHDLANEGEDKNRYPNLYRTLSRKLSEAKATRYDAATLKALNERGLEDATRECSECHRSDVPVVASRFENGGSQCPLCAALGAISRLLPQAEVFLITEDEAENALELPFGYYLSTATCEQYLREKPQIRRIYTKNRWDMGVDYATHIWMGDYTANTGSDFSYFKTNAATLEQDLGIERLGVLRADVDNLGEVFASGIPSDKISISRTATLSRQLSYFFKFRINQILAAGTAPAPALRERTIVESENPYQAQIIYSGGDDLFLVGNWSDIIEAAAAIRQGFLEFTGNKTLTLSAGIGMFEATYPIARMAAATGDLEDVAKLYRASDGKTVKNAVTLWTEDCVYSWDDFTEGVLPLVEEVARMFADCEKGKAFLYRLIALLRTYDEVSSIPRLAYLLARSFEDQGTKGEESSRKLYEWAGDEEKRKQLITAMELYTYRTRERG